MTLTPAPTFTTARLTIRGPEKRDLAAFTHWLGTSSRLTHVGGTVDAAAAWRGFIAGVGHWHWHGFGFFTLEETATGTAMGRIGILHHADWPEPELAWHMFDHGEGHGFATEAAPVIRDWAQGTLGLGPLISMIAPENTRSRALAERLGATVERLAEIHKGEPVLIYRHAAGLTA